MPVAKVADLVHFPRSFSQSSFMPALPKSSRRPILSNLATVAAGLLLTPCCASTGAQAATITLAGKLTGVAGDENDQIDRWRTISVPKTFDPDFDNVYGTAGYVMFAADDAGNANPGTAPGSNVNPFTFVSGTRRTLASLPSFVNFTVVNPASTGVASSYGYRLMDNPALTPDVTMANLESGAALRGVAIGTEASIFDFTVGADFPAQGLRLGLFFSNTDGYNGSFRLEQTVGGAGSVSVTQVSGVPLEMGFFDITNAAQGDTFRIYATKNAGSTGNGNVLLGGLTFDAIPEPSAVLSLLGGFGFLLGARRARRTAA